MHTDLGGCILWGPFFTLWCFKSSLEVTFYRPSWEGMRGPISRTTYRLKASHGQMTWPQGQASEAVGSVQGGNAAWSRSWENIKQGNPIAIYIFPRTTRLGDTEHFYSYPGNADVAGLEHWRAKRQQWNSGSARVQTKVRETESHTCPSGKGNKEHWIHKQTEMLAQETFPALCALTPPCPWLWWFLTLTTLQGHRLSGLSHLIFTGCQSRMSADRATTGFPPAWRPLGQVTGARNHSPGWAIPSWQRDNSKVAFLSLGTEDSAKLLWMQRWQTAMGNPEVPPSFWGFKGCTMTPVLYAPQRQQSPRCDQNTQQHAFPPLSLVHKTWTQTQNGQPPLLNPSGLGKSFSVHVPVTSGNIFLRGTVVQF